MASKLAIEETVEAFTTGRTIKCMARVNTDHDFCVNDVTGCLDNELDVDGWMGCTSDGVFEERDKMGDDDRGDVELEEDNKKCDDDNEDGTGVDCWIMVGEDGSGDGAGVEGGERIGIGYELVPNPKHQIHLCNLNEAVGNVKAQMLCPVSSVKPRRRGNRTQRNKKISVEPNGMIGDLIGDFKALVIRPRKVIQTEGLIGWEPKLKTMMLVSKQTEAPSINSIRDFTYIKKPKFQTKFKKAIPRVDVAGGKDPGKVITSMDVTVKCLVAFVADCRAAAERSYRKGFTNSTVERFVRVSTLNKYFNRKLELFYVGLIVMDYVFRFTNRCGEEWEDDGVTLLAALLANCVADCTDDVDIWEFYGGLLRIFQEPKPEDEQDESRKRELEEQEETRSTLRQKMEKYPYRAMEEVKNNNKGFHPEDYFCDLQDKITQLYGHAKPESPHLGCRVGENDILLVQWHTLQHLYHVKCLDDEAETPLLFYNNRTKAKKDQEIHRHKERGWYDAANRLGYYGIAEKRRMEGMPKNLERESVSSKRKQPQETNGTHNAPTPESVAINRNGSVNLYKSTVIPTLAASITKEVSSKTSPKKKSQKRQKNVCVSGCGSTKKTTATIAVGGGDTSDKDPVDGRTFSSQDSRCVGPLQKRRPVLYTLIGTIDGSYMEGNSYVLNIPHGRDINLHIESSPLQLVYSNVVSHCHDGICRRGMIRDHVIKILDGKDHIRIPATHSYLGVEYGVVRMEHEIIQNKREEIGTIAWIEVVNFLSRSGDMEVACDGATTFRYDFGYTEEDFSWRADENEGKFRNTPYLNKMGPFETQGQINSLGEQMGCLLDMMTRVLSQVHTTMEYPIAASNQFGHEMFPTQLNEKLRCRINRFHTVTIGVTLFTPKDFLELKEQEKAGTSIQRQADDGNRQNKGNDHCCIFHIFLLLHDDQGNQMIARIFVIALTRKSLLVLDSKELPAMASKKKLADYKEHINSFLEGEDKCMDGVATCKTVTPPPTLGDPCANKYSTIPALHSADLSLSAAINIIQKFQLFQSNWFKFLYAGEHLSNDPGFDWDGNRYAQFGEAMDGKGRQAAPSSPIAHYKNEEVLQPVVEYMKTWLTWLNSNGNTGLDEYDKELNKLNRNIIKVVESPAQSITLPATCCGIILTNNVKYDKYGFPSETSDVSRQAYDSFEKEYDQLDKMSHRTSWFEYLLSDVVGRENYIVDSLL